MTLILPQPFGMPVCLWGDLAGRDGDPGGLADELAAATVISANVPLAPARSAHVTGTVAGVVAVPSAFLGFRSRTRSPAAKVIVPGLPAVAGGAGAGPVTSRPPVSRSR